MTTSLRSILLAFVVAAYPVSALADVPVPTVTKVPADQPGAASRNYPFFSTDIVLKNYGYVEEEFFYDGKANTYTTPELGKNADVVTSGISYRSRLLVRRPAQASRFNGVVIVEWVNVTNGYDTDVLWLYQKEFLIREGYAWVGVSAQDGGVSRPPNGIKVWSPTRYGSLDLTGGGQVTDASLNFDIYSQAGAAVKKVPACTRRPAPDARHCGGAVAVGEPHGTVLNGVHSRDPIYDAAFLTVSNQAMRTDLTIPVIKVLSETERATSRREPDSAKVRVWNVAGSTHSEQYSLLSRAAFLKRDLNLEAVDACETPARSRVEIRYVYNAAVDWLVRWTKTGAEAPHAPPLEFDESAPAIVAAPPAPIPAAGTGVVLQGQAPGGRDAAAGGGRDGGAAGRGGRAGGAGGGGGRGPAGPPEKPVKRDEFGNILGGIRTAEIAVPVAKESGELCGLGGTHVPFDAATLNRLYPTHADYVSKVTAASQALVKAGFMLPADAALTIDTAKRSIWGMQLTCGPLCADARQFPSNPSSTLLSKQTSYLLIKGSEPLVAAADEATRLIAEGYTLGADPKARQKFTAAAASLDRYISRVRQIRARGDMPVETETLLVSQATTLQGKLKELGK